MCERLTAKKKEPPYAEEDSALQKNHMEVHVAIDDIAKALKQCHRPRMCLLAVDAAFDCLVDIILTDSLADDRMDLRSQSLWSRQILEARWAQRCGDVPAGRGYTGERSEQFRSSSDMLCTTDPFQ